MFSLFQLTSGVYNLVEFHDKAWFVLLGALQLIQSLTNIVVETYIFCTFDFSGSTSLTVDPQPFILSLRERCAGKLLFVLLESSWIGQSFHSFLSLVNIIALGLEVRSHYNFGVVCIVFNSVRIVAFLALYCTYDQSIFTYQDVFSRRSLRVGRVRRKRTSVHPNTPLSFLLDCELHHGDECGKCCCSICLEQMHTKQVQACFQCNHLFHSGCIQSLLESKAQSPVCPECRAFYTCV